MAEVLASVKHCLDLKVPSFCVLGVSSDLSRSIEPRSFGGCFEDFGTACFIVVFVPVAAVMAVF